MVTSSTMAKPLNRSNTSQTSTFPFPSTPTPLITTWSWWIKKESCSPTSRRSRITLRSRSRWSFKSESTIWCPTSRIRKMRLSRKEWMWFISCRLLMRCRRLRHLGGCNSQQSSWETGSINSDSHLMSFSRSSNPSSSESFASSSTTKKVPPSKKSSKTTKVSSSSSSWTADSAMSSPVSTSSTSKDQSSSGKD